MMRKARLAIRKVNVALDSPGYCVGTGRSLKLVRFPAHSPLPIAALPSMSLFPKTPFARSHGLIVEALQVTLAPAEPGGISLTNQGLIAAWQRPPYFFLGAALAAEACCSFF